MIVVFGSVAVDLVVQVPHIPHPGESLQAPAYTPVPGSKGANQALAAARSGARVIHVASVGRDAYAATATALLEKEGVDLSHLARIDKATGICFVTVAENGGNTVVAAAGANLETSIAQLQSVEFGPDDILVLQMEIPLADNFAAVRLAKERGARVILNAAPAAPIDSVTLAALDFLIVNEHEAVIVAKACGLEDASAEMAGRAIHQRFGCSAIVTLGERGVIAYHGESVFTAGAPKIDVRDTTGAGDTFTGAFAAALDGQADFQTALCRAVYAGSLACTVYGAQTSIPTLDAILMALGQMPPTLSTTSNSRVRR
jgi:ribokinase